MESFRCAPSSLWIPMWMALSIRFDTGEAAIREWARTPCPDVPASTTAGTCVDENSDGPRSTTRRPPPHSRMPWTRRDPELIQGPRLGSPFRCGLGSALLPRRRSRAAGYPWRRGTRQEHAHARVPKLLIGPAGSLRVQSGLLDDAAGNAVRDDPSRGRFTHEAGLFRFGHPSSSDKPRGRGDRPAKTVPYGTESEVQGASSTLMRRAARRSAASSWSTTSITGPSTPRAELPEPSPTIRARFAVPEPGGPTRSIRGERSQDAVACLARRRTRSGSSPSKARPVFGSPLGRVP